MTEGQTETTVNEPVVLSSIPVFPPVAIRLLQLVSHEDVALRQVIELLRADPAFSAEILRRSNSFSYASRQPVTSLQHALVVLGLRRIRGLTLTVASGTYLKAALKIPELQRCWVHTLATALLTEELARACAVFEDIAYTAGLMHDIGRLGLLAAHPKGYAALLQAAESRASIDDEYDLLDHEKKVFTVDHCAVGNYLVEQWGLPEEFRVITGRHHDPPLGTGLDLLSLVYYGCQLADTLGYFVITPRHPRSLDEIREQLPESARKRFHSDTEELRQLIEMRILALDVASAPEEEAEAEAVPEPVVEAPPEAPPQFPPPVEPPPVQPPAHSTLQRDILAGVITVVVVLALVLLLILRLAD